MHFAHHHSTSRHVALQAKQTNRTIVSPLCSLGCNKMSHFNTANVTSIETPLAHQTTSTPENSKNDNEIDAAQKDNIASSKSSNEKEALI